VFFETFLLKCLEGIDILRTFALAFAQKRARAQKKEFFERFT
jgi:hypothetical protein